MLKEHALFTIQMKPLKAGYLILTAFYFDSSM